MGENSTFGRANLELLTLYICGACCWPLETLDII